MKLLRNLIATAILAVMPLAMTTSASAQTFNNGGNGCSVVELAPLNKAFTVSGNTASTTVQVNGPATCKETVSLASWNAPVNSPNFRPFASQSLVAKKTVTLGVGQHVLSIPINSACAYQVDLVLGSRATNASGTADYTPDVMMGYLQVFNKMCTITPPTPPTPPTTTKVNVCSGDTTNVNSGVASQGGNCSTNTTVVQNTPPATPTPAPTPVTPAQAQPTALVNTGPGSVATLFGIATIAGYFIRRAMIRKAFQA